MDDPLPALEDFTSSLDKLDSAFQTAYLDHKTLETYLTSLHDNELTPLQKAQSITMLAYSIYDCVWMWLRAKGVDPNKHPILKELDRIKAQFAKVQAAERAGPSMKLDKDASARLLRQPLKDASQPSKREQQLSDEKEAGTSKAQVPDIGKGTRFNAVAYHDEASKAAQAKVDARQEAAGSSDSDDGDDSLQVFDDDSTAQQQSSNDNPQSAPGSNAASGAEGSASANADKKKRKRRRSKKADAGGQTAAEASSAAASGASSSSASSSSASTKASKNKKKPKHA